MPKSNKRTRSALSNEVDRTRVVSSRWAHGSEDFTSETRRLGSKSIQKEEQKAVERARKELSGLREAEIAVLTDHRAAASLYSKIDGAFADAMAGIEEEEGGSSLEVPDPSENLGADGAVGEGQRFLTALRETAYSSIIGRVRKRSANHRARRLKELAAWESVMDNLVSAYLKWQASSTTAPASPNPNPSMGEYAAHVPDPQSASSEPTSPAPPSDRMDVDNDIGTQSGPTSNLVECTVNVYDIFTRVKSATIYREQESTSAAVDLIRHGLIAKTAVSPKNAVSVTTLELLYRLRQRKASYSIEAFAKMVCDYYTIPYRHFYRELFADTFEVYVRVLRKVDTRVREQLGWDGRDWKIKNECRACCYDLLDEPPLGLSRIVAMDGNNSLKRFKQTSRGQAVDTRILDDSDIFLSRTEVDQFSGEVKLRKGPRVPNQLDESDEDSDHDVKEANQEVEGDPADGASQNVDLDDNDPERAIQVQAVRECTKNWKAAQSDEKKRMWDVYDETGVFVAACRHGMVLTVADMAQSGELAKYPLAVTNKLLDTQKKDPMFAYDIGCNFLITLLNSSLGPKFKEMNGHMCVPAFHGYSHCYTCQLSFHPNGIVGMGIEDAETLERTFSGSNVVASVTRFATPFRRRLAIESYFRQTNEDRYLASGNFILNNYKQAVDIIEQNEQALHKTLADLGLTIQDLQRMGKEQLEFFSKIDEEEQYDWHEVAYVEQLEQLRTLEINLERVNTKFQGYVYTKGAAAAKYSDLVSSGRKAETERRWALEKIDRATYEIAGLEMTLAIDREHRWRPGQPKYDAALRFVSERAFRKALRKLQRLVILRLFELHKLNIAQTGYKMRTHLTKALKTRCRTIKKAIEAYNAAAAKLNPPRRAIDFQTVSTYTVLQEFSLLEGTRNDIRDCEWSNPNIRDVLRDWNRIERAKEEIQRCNIEIRRLHTAICDEDMLFDGVLAHMSSNDPLRHAVQQFCQRRRQLNLVILKRVREVYAQPKYSTYGGIKGPGTAAGTLAGTTRAVSVADIERSAFLADIDRFSDQMADREPWDNAEEEAEAEDEEEEDEEAQEQQARVLDYTCDMAVHRSL